MDNTQIKYNKKTICYKINKIQSTLNVNTQKTELLKRKLEMLYDKVNMLSLEKHHIKKKLKIVK